MTVRGQKMTINGMEYDLSPGIKKSIEQSIAPFSKAAIPDPSVKEATDKIAAALKLIGTPGKMAKEKVEELQAALQ